MKMRYLVGACAGVLLSAAAAHADITAMMQTNIDSPMVRQMVKQSPSLAKMVNTQTTAYYSGRRSRVDTQYTSVIVDVNAHQMIMLAPMNHTYFTQPYNPTAPNPEGPRPNDVKVTDTGHTKTILGHPCREYIVTVSMTTPQTGSMTNKIDMWVATDIAIDPSLRSSGLGAASPVAKQMEKVKGFPLRMTMTTSGGPKAMGGTTVTSNVVRLSTKPVPASKFAIPAGYKKTDAPSMGPMGGPGGPGGPMPPMGP